MKFITDEEVVESLVKSCINCLKLNICIKDFKQDCKTPVLHKDTSVLKSPKICVLLWLRSLLFKNTFSKVVLKSVY